MYRLLIKIHNETGLRYLCRCSNSRWKQYLGSGSYWKRHLSVHGKNVSTILLFETEDIDLFSWVSEECSNEFDVVNSKDWANLQPENGLQGAPIGNTNGVGPHPWMLGKRYAAGNVWTDNQRNAVMAVMKGNKFGVGHGPPIGNKNGSGGKGRNLSEDHKQKIKTAMINFHKSKKSI